MLKEFREFVTRGNLVELAVAFILGVAFTTVVTAFTDVVLGAISFVAGGDVSFDGIGVHRGEELVIPLGAFLTALVDLVLVGLALFFVVKTHNRFRRTPEVNTATRPCPFCRTDIAKEATRCPSCTSQLEAVAG